MIKSVLRTPALGFVLFAGLVSCSKENKTVKDVYSPPGPVVRRGALGATVDSNDVDLQDVLDLAQAKPVKASISGDCTRGGVRSTFEHDLTDQNSVPFFRILPEKYLVQPNPKEQTVCAYKLTLTNSVGSTHTFERSGLIYKDEYLPPVLLGRDDQREIVMPIRKNQMQEIRIRYRSHNPATAEIACEEFSIAPMGFDQVLNLDMFDYHDLKFTKPVQHCRSLIRENGALVALSALFQLMIPLPPLIVKELPPMANPLAVHRAFFYPYRDGKIAPMTLSSFSIENSENTARRIRLAKRRYGLRATFYIIPSIFSNVFSWVQNYLSTQSSAPLVSEDSNSIVYQIDPHAAVNIEVTFTPAPSSYCDATMRGGQMGFSQTETKNVALRLEASEAVQVTEQDSQGVSIETFQLKGSAPLFGSFDGRPATAVDGVSWTAGSVCRW